MDALRYTLLSNMAIPQDEVGLTNKDHKDSGVQNGCVESLAALLPEGRERPYHEGDEHARENEFAHPLISLPKLREQVKSQILQGCHWSHPRSHSMTFQPEPQVRFYETDLRK